MKSECIAKPLVMASLVLGGWPAAAATFTVTTTADAGVGSLRWAISEANLNPGTDTVAFALPGPDYTIVLASPLPTIFDPIIIDGYSGGGTPNSLADGNNAVLNIQLTTSSALTVPTGLLITGGGSRVQGLVFNGFSTCLSLADKGGNIVAGNFFGLNPDGVTVSPRGTGTGVFVSTTNSNNLIGGPTPAARNLLAGMANGIVLSGGSTTFGSTTAIEGNYIGTDRHGTNGLGNSTAGVAIQTRGHRLGGGSVAQRNLISGNAIGVQITGPFNLVQGNFIGTDVTGTLSVSNLTGISVTSGTNQIGGLTATPGAPPGNVISGNFFEGLQSGGTGHVIQGNLIGVDVTGTNRLRNRLEGLQADGQVMTIGGFASGAGNVIAANGVQGIVTTGSGGRSNLIAGNWIGTDASGSFNLGNASHGILISSASSDVIASNVIAFNGGIGIGLLGASATNHFITANAIYANAQGGIDLALNGVTANDACDADVSGPNRFQNFPVLTNVSASAGSTLIEGYLPGEANAGYRLEFFANDACDDSGHGEGQTYLGLVNVAATPNCTNSFSVTLPVGGLASRFFTATATDTNNNTSEFSACYATAAALLPTLLAVPAGAGQVTISWTPPTGTNWVLQERLSLTTGAWTNSPSGWTNPVTVPAALPAKFYRLFKP